MGLLASAKRMWRHPTLQTWISRQEYNVHQVTERIAAIAAEIAAAETELADAALASTLAGDNTANEIASRLASLRSQRDVLEIALGRAEDAERQRVADAANREAASAARAARQHAGRMVRAARECSTHIEALQKSFDTMCQAADSASILLPLPIHFKVGDLLTEHHMREVTKAEAHRHARQGVHQFLRAQDAPMSRAIEDFATGAMPSLETTISEIAAAVKRVLSPPAPKTEPASQTGDTVVPGGVAVEGDAPLLAATPEPADDAPEPDTAPTAAAPGSADGWVEVMRAVEPTT